jgi:beta-lactam-binding protein with PASTA domain
MNHSWWLEYMPIIFLVVTHIVIGLQFAIVFLTNSDKKEKDVEKKSFDKSDGFLAGLLVGWFFF